MGKHSPLIMVVDDELNMCTALQRILETEGYRVVIAPDGPTALRLIPETKPDLLLLDIMMPGMNGREVSLKARHLWNCPIIYFTARADLARPEKARELYEEVDGFLVKPATSRRILTMIEGVLSQFQR